MTIPVISTYVGAAAGLALALSGALRARRSVSRWAFVAGMVVLAAERLCSGFYIGASTIEAVIRWKEWEFVAASFLPGIWILFSVTYSRGNYRDFLARWRYALAAAFILPPAVSLVFRRDLIVAVYQPATESNVLRLLPAGVAAYALLLIAAVLVLTNLERTYRAAVGTMRWRIKYMLLGVGLLFVVRVYTSSQALLYRGIDPSLETFHSGALLLAALLIVRSLVRAGHFDLDVYPSRAVIHSSLTVLLAGIYLLIVGVFAKAVVYFGGGTAFALKALLVLLALVALAVLLQSDRIRLHLRRFVSRQFQRPVYEYRTVWRRFTEATASRVEQTDLCRALVKLTADTFNALSVSLWLTDERKETLVLAASTARSEAPGSGAEPAAGARDVLAHFQLHPEPVDFETAREPWAAALRQWHPCVFPRGGNRVCLPLIGRGELLGLVTLGDRVGGFSFSLQDFDMLKCIGDHVAASLLNIRLSRQLLQAKEIEAFQTMATFFVHDLKNAASTLNLMFQNLPEHFDDPSFREDALRGVSKSVAHINHLVERLTTLRHEAEIRPQEADLNEVVRRVLDGLEPAADGNLVRELSPLPPLRLDLEQAAKVVTNVVLNAREAVAANGGRVRVATGLDGAWAVLTVSDNGCGMSPEFLRRSLFRPFQTTKKNGLGIGMFQSKTIVEAHGGRVEVESEPGRGTTFRILWPVSKP